MQEMTSLKVHNVRLCDR